MTSLVGAMATAPFAVYHFDRLAPYGLMANLLAMPIISFVSAPVAGLALVAAPFGLSDLFLGVFGWSLERVLDIAYWAAGPEERGFRIGEAMPAAVLIVLICGLAGVCLGTRWWSRLVMGSAAFIAAMMIWMLSPKLVLHWSASGDVFAASDSGMIRIALQDGEGLNPLRFSDLERERDCSAGCRLETHAGTLLAGPGDWVASRCDLHVTFVLTSDEGESPRCPAAKFIEHWKTVQPAGGVSVQQTFDGRLVRHVPRCGHRPWVPCLDARNKQDQS